MQKVLFLTSYGDKYGSNDHFDMVFDTKLLDNPYYHPKLKNLNGLNEETKVFLQNNTKTKEFLKLLDDYLDFYLPSKLNKHDWVSLAFKCSGGFHRSVFVSHYVALKYKSDYVVILHHKDILKG